MSVVLNEIVLAVNDLPAMTQFWSQVLQVPAEVGSEPGEAYAELVLQPGLSLLLLEVPEGKTTQNRLHLDLSPRGAGQDQEVERVLALGARRTDVGQGPDVSWVVLADPEGNEFCILRSRQD